MLLSVSNYTILIRENQVKTSSAGIQDLGTGSDSNISDFTSNILHAGNINSC